MKTFTCSSLGGPTHCMFYLSGSTPEELLKNVKDHIEQIANSGDALHSEILNMMRRLEGTQEGVQWKNKFFELWDAKLED